MLFFLASELNDFWSYKYKSHACIETTNVNYQFKKNDSLYLIIQSRGQLWIGYICTEGQGGSFLRNLEYLTYNYLGTRIRLYSQKCNNTFFFWKASKYLKCWQIRDRLHSKRISVFATNSDFPIPVSLQPDSVNVWYFKLRWFDLTELSKVNDIGLKISRN